MRSRGRRKSRGIPSSWSKLEEPSSLLAKESGSPLHGSYFSKTGVLYVVVPSCSAERARAFAIGADFPRQSGRGGYGWFGSRAAGCFDQTGEPGDGIQPEFGHVRQRRVSVRGVAGGRVQADGEQSRG